MFSFVVALLGVPPWAAREARAVQEVAESLSYVLTPDFERGRLKVEVTWQTGDRRQSILSVSPRFGQIENVAALLGGVRFDGPGGMKRDGSMWILEHSKRAAIRAEYEINEIKLKVRDFDDWRGIHLPVTTPEVFHAVGSAFLLTPNSGPGTPGEFDTALRWVLPAGAKAVCSWGVGRSVGARMKPADLRQSVYFAGRLSTKTLTQGGGTITVAIQDRFGFKLDELADVSGRIIAAECAFMGEKRFPDFVITALPAGGPLKEGEARLAGSGLFNSFALYMAPGSRLDDSFENLFAHELFHHWNGRTLAAASPERRMYWFVEGFTDYFALRILHEQGLWDAGTYAKWVNKHLREYAANPAKNASNEEIEREYWAKRDTVGQVAYQRGMLLGLRWAGLARKNGRDGALDKLMRALVERGRIGAFELTNEVFRKAVVEALGPWVGPEFDTYVTGAQTISVPADALSPGLTGLMQKTCSHELGFDREASLRERRVSGLVPGSAAAAAGLKNGDKLVSWSISGDDETPTRLTVQRGRGETVIEYRARGPALEVVQFRPAGAKKSSPK